MLEDEEEPKWKYRAVNKRLIPRAYLKPNDKAIKAAIKRGVRKIKGIVIYQEEGVRA